MYILAPLARTKKISEQENLKTIGDPGQDSLLLFSRLEHRSNHFADLVR
jgi:hypothetical protein